MITRVSVLSKAKTAEEILSEFQAAVAKGEFFDLSEHDADYTFRREFSIDKAYEDSVYRELLKKNFENWASLVESGKITELTRDTMDSIQYTGSSKELSKEGKRGDFAARLIETIKDSKLKKVEFSQRCNSSYSGRLEDFTEKEIAQFYAALPDTVKKLSSETYEEVKATEFKAMTEWLERTHAHPDVDIYTHNGLSSHARAKMSCQDFERFAQAVSKARSFRFGDFGDSYLVGEDTASGYAFDFRKDLVWYRRGDVGGEPVRNLEHEHNFEEAQDLNNRYVPNERVERLLDAFHQERAILNSKGELFFSSDERLREAYVKKGIEEGDACLAHGDLCERFDKAREELAARRRKVAMKADKILHTGQFFTNMRAPGFIRKKEVENAKAQIYQSPKKVR